MAKPYVTAAFFCEKVLQEKDEVISVVRIVDRLQYRLETHNVPNIPENLKPVINVQGLVAIKSGPVTGEYKISLVMEKPSGARKEIFSAPVKLLGKDQGQNIIINVGIGVNEDGLYWMDVLCDDDMLTRVPLMITQQETPASKAQTP